MKFLVVALFAILAVASAAPSWGHHGAVVAVPVAHTAVVAAPVAHAGVVIAGPAHHGAVISHGWGGWGHGWGHGW